MADVKVVTAYLIYDVRRDEFKVRRTRPSGRFGEFAYRIRVVVPKSWGGVLGDIELTLAEPPLDYEPTVDEIETPLRHWGDGAYISDTPS